MQLLFLGAGWLGFACSNLLGISEPIPLEVTSGASGSLGAGAAGTEASNAGADDAFGGLGATAGDGGEPPSIGGAAGAGGAGGQVEPNPPTDAGNGGEGGQLGPVPCVAAATKCSGNELQRCEGGAWVDDQACAAYCLSGACVNPPSCGFLGNLTCGDAASCCRALEVPGGSFVRDYDGIEYLSQNYTATVSSFVMDRFEVSVGRFLAFFNAYDQISLKAGAGKSPHVDADLGWQDSFPIPKSREDLKTQLHCTDTTWDDELNGDLDLPVNCVNFYVAYAFCIWDLGRLPTEAEWNYAAAGGDEQREYPWSTVTNSGLDLEHAYYDQSSGLPIDVGMDRKGDGRWGHSDLSGNVREWTLDYFSHTYPSTRCEDCVNAIAQPTRAIRGGAYRFKASSQKVGYRTSGQPDLGASFTGFRCVHDIPTAPQD